MCASYKGHLETIKVLFQNGANVNIQHSSGNTALMFASNNGHFEIIKFLVEHGANVNTQNNNGWTALDFAKTTEIRAFLRNAGAKE